MKNLTLLILILAINLMPVKAQEIGEVWSCHTADDINSKSITQNDISARSTYDTNPKIINIYVHIIRQSSGSGGLSISEVNSTLNLLYLDYSSANITFNEIGRSYINNSTFYSGIDDSNYSSLISTNSHSNAIDIYFLSPSDSYSRASGIPGTALAIGGAYAGTSVLSHETGHTLGLYHTHSGSGCYDYANCSENIDGSNCSTCGDLTCDTPADPCLSGKVTTGCIYVGDSRYTPDVNNIMSYAPPSCLTHFSNGQIERLHDMITNASILQSAWAPIYFSGSTSLCYSGSPYSISSLPSGASITWSASSNIVRVSSQGANPCTFKAAEGNVGTLGTITADISINSNNIAISKNVSMGVIASISGSSSVLVGKTGTWNASASCSKSPYNYSWYLRKDGTGQAAAYVGSGSSLTLQSVSAGSSNPMIRQPITRTIFYLYALAVDANGNSDASIEKRITAYGNVDLIPMYLPKSATTKSASLSDEEQSINEALDEIESFVVYPNPTSNYIYIEIPSILLEEQTCTVILYNSGMREMKTFKVNERIESIDIFSLTSGLYFLQLSSGKQILTKKIIKH